MDWDNGFGGLASCLAQELSDEFGRKSVMAVAASPLTVPLDKTETFHSSLLNHALSLDCLSSHCSAFFPLSLLTNPWRTVPQTPTMSDHNLRDFHLRNYEVCYVPLRVFLSLLPYNLYGFWITICYFRYPWPTTVHQWWPLPWRRLLCSTGWSTLLTLLALSPTHSLREEER